VANWNSLKGERKESDTPVNSIEVQAAPVRRIEYSQKDRVPLEGHTKRQSEILRSVVGLKYSGKTLKEAFDIVAKDLEISSSTVENVWYKHPGGIDAATAEHLEMCLREYNTKMWIFRDALYDAVPRAIRVLDDLVTAPDASNSIKHKSAVAILRFANVNDARAASTEEETAKASLKLLMSKTKETSSHIVDAEFEEDNESEN
jgi:hypothetical protein